MILIPYEKQEIPSEKSPDEVMEGIKDITQEQEHLSFTAIRFMLSDKKKFAGEIGEDSFRISRIIIGRNSFLPVIKGKVEKTDDGSKTMLEMDLSKITAGFMAIVFLIILIAAIVPLFIEGFTPKTSEQLLVWAGIFLAIFAFMTISFRLELGKAKKLLNDVFKG